MLKKKAASFKNFHPSSARASQALSRIKSTGNKAETLLRSRLWRLGVRFRKNFRDLPGKPDIVFLREKVAVFCDGDFWHGRNWVADKKRLQKGPNATYWVEKIQANKDRDKRHNKQLERLGWIVLRYWESDIVADPDSVAMLVAQTALSRRESC